MTRAGAQGTREADAPKMPTAWRRWLSAYLAVALALVLGHFLWAWSTAFRLVASDDPVRVRWLFAHVEPTDQFAVMLLVVLAAMTGSLATSALVFSMRAGYGTLEDRWQHWYLLRPLIAAGIGVLLHVTVVAGLLGPVADSTNDLAMAAAVGGLAGLFTDQVLASMRRALGASPFNVGATAAADTGEVPGTARRLPQPTEDDQPDQRRPSLDARPPGRAGTGGALPAQDPVLDLSAGDAVAARAPAS